MLDFKTVSLIVVAILNVFLAAVIYFRNKRSEINLSFSAFAFSVGLWSFVIASYRISQNLGTAMFLMRSSYIVALAIGASFFYFSLVFPIKNRSYNFVKVILSFFFFGFIVVAFIPNLLTKYIIVHLWGKEVVLGWSGYLLFTLFFVSTFVVGLIILWKKFFTNSGIVKKQLLFIALSVSIAGLFGILFNLFFASPFLQNFKYIWAGPLFTTVIVGAITYAIIRHRLLDIRLFVIRSILYTLTVIMVGGLFTLIVFSLGENILGSTFWGVIIGSVIISLGLEPLLHFLRRVTDQYFFQEKYNYQKTLKELVESMTKIIDLQNLLDTTTATIKGALRIERIAIVLWDEDNSLPLEVKQVGFSVPLDTHFSKKKPLVQHLASTKDELVAGELEIEMERGRLNMPMARAQSIVREMRNLDIAVCFPIISNDNLIGILALGNKQSGDVFSDDDIKLLNTFSYQAGIAIVNARLYQEVKDFNAKLQEKIDRATEHLRKKNEELHKANIKLKELDQAKSDFLSLASHQLRAPLSITKGYVSMILEGTYGACPQEMIDPLEMVYNGNERLVKFVNNLLDVSRMESGRLEYIFKEVDLAEMASSVVKELKLAADKKDLYLDLKIDNSVPKIQADDEKLRQVVMNLVDNAIKYTAKGGVSVNLKHGKNKEGKNGLIFSVTDTGRGMEENDKASLFQKFSRGKGISRIHTEGTGLGLYVAAKIVEAHHGIIWADSPGKDQGSTFAFWVPAGE